MVLTGGAFVGSDQVAGSVPIVCSIRGRNQVEEWLDARIHSDSDTPIRRRRAAGRRIGRRGQQSSMGQRVWRRGNRGGRPDFTKSLVVCEEEGPVALQRPSPSNPKLIADETRYRGVL